MYDFTLAKRNLAIALWPLPLSQLCMYVLRTAWIMSAQSIKVGDMDSTIQWEILIYV